MATIMIVGDASIDLTMMASHVPAPDEKVHCEGIVESFGGVAANTAVAAARTGADVIFAGSVGMDQASRSFADHMQAEGIQLQLAHRQGSLCRVVSIVEPHGEKRLFLYPGASLYPSLADVEGIVFEGVDHLHTAIYGAAGFALIERARENGISWSIDLEPATFSKGIGSLSSALSGAQTVFVNDRAASQIGDDYQSILTEMNVRSIVRTLGPRGAAYSEPPEAQAITCAAPENMPIVDTTGAGDCLAGWFLAGRTRHENAVAALKDAVLAATLACGTAGAQGGYPSIADIEQLKSERDLT